MREPQTTDGTPPKLRHHIPQPPPWVTASLLVIVALSTIAAVNHTRRTTPTATSPTTTSVPSGTTAPGTVPAVSTTTVPVPYVPATTTGTTPEDAPPDPVPTVTWFLAAWLAPGTPDERSVALAPLVTDDLLPLVAVADRLPQGTVVSVVVVSVDVMAGVVGFSLSDGSVGRVGVVMTAVGWRVASITKT